LSVKSSTHRVGWVSPTKQSSEIVGDAGPQERPRIRRLCQPRDVFVRLVATE
jgi:hypothetical protein